MEKKIIVETDQYYLAENISHENKVVDNIRKY